MTTLLHSARVLTMCEETGELENGYVLVDGERIADVSAQAPDRPLPPADRQIDCRGGILLPGFVNLHCHASMVPFRSMGDDCPDRLRRFLFPLERDALTRELVYLGAKYAIGEMFLSGITTFVDMYYFEDEVAKACEETGMRGYLGETVLSQVTPSAEHDREGLRLTREFLSRWHGHPLVHPIVAPHGTTTVSPEALRACHELAREYDTLMTLHVSEMDDEMRYFEEMGTTPLGYLDSLSCVDRHLLAAHCIHLTDGDVKLLAGRGAKVAHCIGSNAKAGKGIAPIRDLRDQGVGFGFGTDGPSSGNTLSILDQMRLFAVTQKTKYHDRKLFPAREIVRAATRGAAECLSPSPAFGYIAKGASADLVLISTDSPAMFPAYNPYSALVYAAGTQDVSLVMAGGKIVVEDHSLTAFSLKDVRAQLQRAMVPFVEAAEKYPDCV
ncbi:MAG: amidohydrolase [Clostridia bacterium]|nr:amidohydrolase [Clostridia bacterium]